MLWAIDSNQVSKKLKGHPRRLQSEMLLSSLFLSVRGVAPTTLHQPETELEESRTSLLSHRHRYDTTSLRVHNNRLIDRFKSTV
jgi:hypothetical protein